MRLRTLLGEISLGTPPHFAHRRKSERRRERHLQPCFLSVHRVKRYSVCPLHVIMAANGERPAVSAASADVRMAAFGSSDAAELVSSLQAVFRSGRTRSAEWREAQLRGIARLVEDNEEAIFAALTKDLRRSRVENILCETVHLYQAAEQAARHVRKWMRPQRVSTNFVNLPGSSEIVSEPYGVVLVFSAWNMPIALSLEPVVGAIAAGNAVVLKPSELAPASSALLADLVPRYVDPEAVRVVEGGADVATALLEPRWDKILYTGSTRIGRIVSVAAARHLTPVTLELGGKNPLYIDGSADFDVGVKRVAFGVCINAGQSCLSPDYVLVEDKEADRLVDTLRRTLDGFYGANPQQSTDLARIATAGGWERLDALLKHADVAPYIVHGGQTDRADSYVAPTIVYNPPLESPIMQEEGFGPVVTVIKVPGPDAAIDIINSRPKPLAVYVFSTTPAVVDRFVRETSSGGVCVNDTVAHYTNPALPFGGVGESGTGSYHGKHSFDCFSHKKSVLRKGTLIDFPLRYPPSSTFNELLGKAILNLWFFQVILVLLGLKKK
eukprot:TRINITY_DN6370_c0_g2_i2.p1 TRINITY_DN6370_c0_g2~~TRINITY_DN6370_c0_g2_i2.p1  ORF type:complete len:554 (+),score=-20.53 TRINITY_DN6370_c0_g2_i2:73-1734(+)